MDNNEHDYETSHSPLSGDVISPLPAYHNAQEAFITKITKREEEKNISLQPITDTDRNIKLPLRVLYEQKKMDMGKLPLWYLQAIGSMTIQEYNNFLKENEGKLTMNEIAASDLMNGVIRKDPESVKRYWDIQSKLLKSPQVIQQVNNNITVNAPMRATLDAIASRVINNPAKKANFDERD